MMNEGIRLEFQEPLQKRRIYSDEDLKGKFTFSLLWAVLATGFGSCFIFGYNIGVMNAAGSVRVPYTFFEVWKNINLQPKRKRIKKWIADCQGWTPINNASFSLSDKEYLNDLSFENQGQLVLIWSVVVGIFPFGGMFGGLLTGFIADKFGRKIGMLMNNSLTILGGLLMACSKPAGSWILLAVGRFIIGINAGLNSGLAPMYLTEISPLNYRGRLGSVNQLMVTVAILFANLLGMGALLGTTNNWPYLLGFTILPAIWQLISLPFAPESPKYLLINKDRPLAAKSGLVKLRGTAKVDAEMMSMMDEAEEIRRVQSVAFMQLFKHKVLRWATVLAVMMMLSQQLSGINATMFYSTQIFENDAKLSTSAAMGATLATMVVNVLMTFVSAILVDNAGRRTLQLVGLAGMWLSSYLLVVSLELSAKNVGWAAYFSILFVILFVISFATGPGSIPWFYVSEVFEQSARGHANSIAVGMNWFACFMVGLLFPPIQHAIGQFTFLIFTVFLSFFLVFTYVYVPETKNKTPEAMMRELGRFVNRKKAKTMDGYEMGTPTNS